MRERMKDKGVGEKPGFRWRGHEISRIEGLSDAVFGFAITLLVVSLEVPKTFNELVETMKGFAAFAISFVLLFQVWYYQYLFFRRYSLQDMTTMILNAALLFIVLFYVYPLKFVFSLLVNELMGMHPEIKLPDGTVEPMIHPEQSGTLIIIYGLGFVAVFLTFTLLYAHAYRRRAKLELTDCEIFDTRQSIYHLAANAMVGLISITVAAFGGPGFAGKAGMIYLATGVPHMIIGSIMGRKRRRLYR
jgi:uncharacterized membrane protein